MTSVLGATLPETWRVSPLKYLTSMIDRGLSPDYVDNGPVRTISQAANQAGGLDWTRTRFHNYHGDVRRLRGYLLENDIMVNSTGTGTLGRIGYFPVMPHGSPCIVDGHLTIVRTLRDILDPRFCYYWLSSKIFQDYLHATLTVGATNQIELSRERLRDAPVAVPPIRHQRQVAEFLDANGSIHETLSSAIKLRLDGFEDHRRAAIDEAFKVLGDSRAYRLGYAAELITSGSRGWGDYAGTHGAPFFRSANLRRNSIQPNLSNLARVDLPSHTATEARRSRIATGDVLVGITGANTGWTALAPDNLTGGHVSQHVCLIRVASTRIDSKWLAYFVSSPRVQAILMGGQYGGTKTQLSLPDIRNIRIPTTSLKDQKHMAAAIASNLDAVDQNKNLRLRQLQTLIERRQALITAAVTGQVDIHATRRADVQ